MNILQFYCLNTTIDEKINKWIKWKQKSILILTIIIYLYMKQIKCRSMWLNHLRRSYGLSNMNVMPRLGIVRGLTN
jgi:hypothetical protein